MVVVGGPLFSLRVWGLFCPCCETDENKCARHSLSQLNRLGGQVDWHRTPNTKRSSVAEAAGGFVKSLFGGNNNNSNTSSIIQSHTDEKPPILAQLRLVDATKDTINWGQPYPELQIVPKQPAAINNGNSNTASSKNNTSAAAAGGGGPLVGGGLLKQNAMSYQLDIPLHHVVRIESIEPTMLVIITKDVHSIDNSSGASEKETARISFPSSDDRDAVSLDLKVLVEWNKHRQPDVEEELPAMGIQQRAQKVAHFAKREIEMREKKREREKRKAGHMQGTMGLKYTALAMANQAS